MDTQTLKTFLLGCTILNVLLLTGSFLLWMTAADFIYRLHGRWFPMPRETFNTVFYVFLGIYKLLVYVFNIVPWIVLMMLG